MKPLKAETEKKYGTKYGKIGLIILQDAALSTVASLLAIMLVRWISAPTPQFSTLVLHWMAFSLAAVCAAFMFTRSWQAVRRYPTAGSLVRLIAATVIKEILLGSVLLAGWVQFPAPALGLTGILSDFLITSTFLILSRIAARQLANESTHVQDVSLRKTALVAGTGQASLQLATDLERNGEYTVVALVTRDRTLSGRVMADRIVVFCEDSSDLDRLQWQLGGIDCVFFPKDEGTQRPDTNGEKEASDKTFPPCTDGMSAIGHFIKHTADTLISGVLLLLFSPLAALCALAVKIGDGGPVIFAQERIGLHGQPFKIYKFRTMRVDAEAIGTPVLAEGDADPRLTKVGRFLRAHHLDELPQLWNVFKGDMALVGYRPERAYYIEQIMAENPRYRFLYQMRPGITSYATLYNGYTSSMEKMHIRLKMDLYYLRTRSVWTDIRVLSLTFLRIVAGKRF